MTKGKAKKHPRPEIDGVGTGKIFHGNGVRRCADGRADPADVGSKRDTEHNGRFARVIFFQRLPIPA